MKNNLLRTFPFLVDEAGHLNVWGDLVSIFATLFIAWLVVNVLARLIQRWGDRVVSRQLADNPGRVRTVTMMAKAVTKVIVWFAALTAVLEIFGINTASLVATAGVGALAIGFGAQSLVKDVISGFFILWEDQFSVGDLVKTGDFMGTVKELGVRTTKLLDFDGSLHIIPNGEIKTVTNYSRGPARALVQVPISYTADIDTAIGVLSEAMGAMAGSDLDFVEGPLVQGVSEFQDSAMAVQVYAMVAPGLQWAAERKIRQVAKEALEKVDIDIPYPQMEVKMTMDQEKGDV